MMQKLKETFVKWLPLGISIVLISGLIYFVVEQSYRSSANDPQVQISEDVATAIQGGNDPSSLLGSSTVDMANTLSNIAIIYDDSGKVVASTGTLNNNVPTLPKGVLDTTRKNGSDTFTWSPDGKNRYAANTKAFDVSGTKGFVIIARSLREVDRRIKHLAEQIVVGTVLILLITFWAVYLTKFPLHLRKSKKVKEDKTEVTQEENTEVEKIEESAPEVPKPESEGTAI